MKNNILLLFIVTFTSCQSYRNFTKIRIDYTSTGIDTLRQSRIIDGYINGKLVNLLFDTGANRTVIFDIDKIGGELILNSVNSTKISASGALTKAQLTMYHSDSLRFSTFSSVYQPIVIAQESSMKNTCLSIVDGMLGLDAFADNSKPLLLNYESGVISWTDSSTLKDYQQVDASFRHNSIYINCKVGSTTASYLFDTGADFSILTNQQMITRSPILEAEVLIQTMGDGLRADACLVNYFVDNVVIGGIIVSEALIETNDKVAKNSIGLAFIKNYNWCIDFESKKLYAKKINSKYKSIDLLKKLDTKSPKVLERNGKLLIGIKKINDKKYSIGDQIMAVNNTKVSDNNICEMVTTLNQSDDWSSLKLEILNGNTSKQ